MCQLPYNHYSEDKIYFLHQFVDSHEHGSVMIIMLIDFSD